MLWFQLLNGKNTFYDMKDLLIHPNIPFFVLRALRRRWKRWRWWWLILDESDQNVTLASTPKLSTQQAPINAPINFCWSKQTFKSQVWTVEWTVIIFFLIWFNFESFYRKSHFILRFLAAGYGGTSVFQVNHFAFTREQQLTAWDEKTRSACGICVSTSASPFSTHFFFLRFALWDF